MCIKKGRNISLLWGEERGKKLQRPLTNFLLGQYYRNFLVFGCTCFVHIPAQLREKLSPRQPLLSFLDMLSPGIDAMTWNPRDSMYPWIFSFMGSLHIFLNLINKPRGVMEMYCGLLLFIKSNLILLQLMLRISLTLQASSFAQHLLPIVSLFSWPQRIPVTRHSMFYSRRQLQSVSQGQTTPEDPQSSPVASSDSGSLSQVRRSSQVSYPVEGFFS